jgi:type II secretory pathway pseudopilin PulG
MKSQRNSGFTLVEALVALMILIALSVILYRGLSSGLRISGVTENAERALFVAKAKLAALGVEAPLQAMDLEGSEDGIAWRIAARPYDENGAAATETELRAYWITVTVSWRDRNVEAERGLRLTTLKLGPSR